MENLESQSPQLETMTVGVPLAVFGKKTIQITNPSNQEPLDIAVRALDPVAFLCVRWPDHPEVVAGVPIVPGADRGEVTQAAMLKLQSEYTRLGHKWPGPELTIEA